MPVIRARAVKSLEDEQRRLNTAVQAADLSVQASSAYAAELASPGQASAPFSMYYTPAMLEQLATQMVPYRMAGREFNSKLAGEIVIERLMGFQFISRNRVRCRAQLRGDNVRYTGKVPAMFKGEVQAFQKAIASGALADLEIQLSLEGSMVRAKAEAIGVQLDRQAGRVVREPAAGRDEQPGPAHAGGVRHEHPGQRRGAAPGDGDGQPRRHHLRAVRSPLPPGEGGG